MANEISPRRANAEGRGTASSSSDRTNFAQRVNLITPLGEALDGTPQPKRRRAPGKAQPATSGAVATTFKCRCTFRTSDRNAYDAHLVAELADIAAERDELRDGVARRRDGRRLIAVCGTSAGYQRHRGLGERACGACLRANAEISAANRAKPGAAEKRAAYRADPVNRARRNELARARYAARKAAAR